VVSISLNLFGSDRKVYTKTSLQGLFSKMLPGERKQQQRKKKARNFAIFLLSCSNIKYTFLHCLQNYCSSWNYEARISQLSSTKHFIITFFPDLRDTFSGELAVSTFFILSIEGIK